MNVQTKAAPAIDQLRSALRGRVITPDDSDYDELRQVAAGGIDRRPAAIARPVDAADVARVVDIARETGLPLAVRSGGHSGAGHGVVDDVEGRTAWVETGMTAGEYTTAAAAHGLATGFGDTGSVGIGGITLGGGIGYLVRKHGLTIDSLLAAEVVTADGQLRRVDAESEPDLFWAIRGGGGNFGVATRFKFRLHELPSFVGGMLLLPLTADSLAGFIAAAEAAPEELSTIANVMPCPPMPFVPQDRHGELMIMAMMGFAGPADEGERVLAPFRAIATPVADMVRPSPYPDMYPPEDSDYRPIAVARAMFLDRVDKEAADRIVRDLAASPATFSAVQLRVLGGAMARVPVDATAFAHRRSRILGIVVAFSDAPEDMPERKAWVESLSSALHQGDNGVYVNFLDDEGEERVRAAYPGATWDRLARIKASYDPGNLFRSNQNIPPA